MDYLIILDFNGVLVHKVKGKKNPCVSSCEHIAGEGEWKNMIPYKVWVPNNLNDFLSDLLQTYKVAIWSSTTEKNFKRMIKYIDKDILNKMEFIWSREHCEYPPDFYDLDPDQTVKNLKRVWKNAVVNKDHKWNSMNTIIVDDTESKILMNNEENTCLNRKLDLSLTRKLIDDKIIELKRLYLFDI